MTSEPVQNRRTDGWPKALGKAIWAKLVGISRLPGNAKKYFSGRGGWFWFPVSFVGACSVLASSIVFMGAFITGNQEGDGSLAYSSTAAEWWSCWGPFY